MLCKQKKFNNFHLYYSARILRLIYISSFRKCFRDSRGNLVETEIYSPLQRTWHNTINSSDKQTRLFAAMSCITRRQRNQATLPLLWNSNLMGFRLAVQSERPTTWIPTDPALIVIRVTTPRQFLLQSTFSPARRLFMKLSKHVFNQQIPINQLVNEHRGQSVSYTRTLRRVVSISALMKTNCCVTLEIYTSQSEVLLDFYRYTTMLKILCLN